MSSINARMIIEIMGKPKEHVAQALSGLIEKLGKEKGVTILSNKEYEPRAVEKSKELFTNFAEIEVEFDSLNTYFGILFAYMPSNIEIISPDKFKLDNFELNAMGNALVTRLHNYDAIAKQMIGERNMLINKVKELGGQVETNNEVRVVPENTEKVKTKKSRTKKTKKKN